MINIRKIVNCKPVEGMYFYYESNIFLSLWQVWCNQLKMLKKKKQTKYDSIGEKKILPGLGKGHPAW